MSALLLMLVLSVAGAPAALRLCGPRAEAAPLAPLLGAGFLAAGALVEVAIGGPPLLDALVALAVGALAPLASGGPRLSVPRGEALLLAAPVLVLGWLLTTLQRVQVSYDGRSIWFFHARMIFGGQGVYLAQAHLFTFSHPDYPPLVPAAVALGWRVAGATDYRTGQLVVAALTGCATLLAALALARALGPGRRLGPVVAAVGVAVAYGVWGQYASNGFVDPLCAALVLAAAFSGLLAPPDAAPVPLALTLVVLAAATKNEGLVFALVVLALMAVRRGAPARRGATGRRWFALALAASVSWPLVMRARGISSDLTGAAPYGVEATDPLHRMAVVVDALAGLLPAAGVGLVGLLAVSALGGREQRACAAWFVGALLACTAALLVVYGYGPLEIHSWVMSSLSRTSMTLRAGGLLAAVYAAGLALRVLTGTRPRSALDEGDTDRVPPGQLPVGLRVRVDPPSGPLGERATHHRG